MIVCVCRLNERFAHLQLNDLRKEATLGVGGFGRVELVTLADNKSVSYALKYDSFRKSRSFNPLFVYMVLMVESSFK